MADSSCISNRLCVFLQMPNQLHIYLIGINVYFLTDSDIWAASDRDENLEARYYQIVLYLPKRLCLQRLYFDLGFDGPPPIDLNRSIPIPSSPLQTLRCTFR